MTGPSAEALMFEAGEEGARFRTCARAGDEPDVAVVERLAADAVDQHRLDALAAVAIDENERRPLGRARPAIAPDHERGQHREEVAALIGEAVFIAPRPLAVAALLEQAGGDELLQAAAQ